MFIAHKYTKTSGRVYCVLGIFRSNDKVNWKIEEINPIRNTYATPMADNSAETSVSSIIQNFHSDWNVSQYQYGKNDKFSDIVIRVGNTSFKLHRIVLSLKSNYFKKLLMENIKEIEIDTIEEGVFTDVVKVIYGEELHHILTDRNFASVFIAMDYLQLEIELGVYEEFVLDLLKDPRNELSTQIYKLYDFLKTRSQYANLLPSVHTYLSNYLPIMSKANIFSHLSIAELESIIKKKIYPKFYYTETLLIDRICASWICGGIDERLKYIVTLVNAVKYRYDESYSKIAEKSHDKQFLMHEDEDEMLEKVAQYFYELRTSYGEIDCNEPETKGFVDSSMTCKQGNEGSTIGL